MSDPADVFERHTEEFGGMADWLGEFYAGHENGARIVGLLEFWIYAFRSLLAAYGGEGARGFAASGFRSHLRYAYLHEYGVDIDLGARRPKGGWIFFALAATLPVAYLPGGRVRSIASKVLARVTRFVSARTPVAGDPDRKEAITDRLGACFRGEDAEVVKDCIARCLPPIFYSPQVALRSSEPLVVDCAPAALMDFCGYESLLLLSRPLRVIGRQHGGGYEMFVVDYWVAFEKKLCDVFIGWGMSAVNERQHRYLASPADAEPGVDGKRIVVVERPLLPLIMRVMSPPIYAHFSNTRPISYVFDEITAAGLSFATLAYPGRMKSPAYAGMRGEEIVSKTGRGEDVIRPTDVVVFDIFAASLIHYCVEAGVTFIVVLSREDVTHFSAEYCSWFEALREGRLAFFDDEPGMLAAALRETTDTGYRTPASVSRFHREKFMDLPAAGSTAHTLTSTG